MTNLLKHSRFPNFYRSNISNEIEFISTHFYEICCQGTDDYDQLKKLGINILYEIIHNVHIELNDEDQLLEFINELYSNDHKYSVLYEKVEIKYVSSEKMKDFIEIYDQNDITVGTWQQLCSLLESGVNFETNDEILKSRYHKKPIVGKTFTFTENGGLNGIINHLRSQASNQIENEINVTASSCNGSSYEAINTVNYENKQSVETKNEPNSWVRFDFKNHQIIPTDYTIRSSNYSSSNWHHPKSWVIEILKENDEWETIDTQNDVSYLNERYTSHSFKIKNPPKSGIRSIRIRQTSKNWSNCDYLIFDSFEIFGTLI